MKAQYAQEAQDIQALKPEGQYEHAEATDQGDQQEGDQGHFTVGVPGEMQVINLCQDEYGCHQQESPRAFQEGLGARFKELDGHDISKGEEDIEFHPVGKHTEMVDVGRKQVEYQADDKLQPVWSMQLCLDQQVGDGSVEQGREIPELVQE